VISLRPAPKAKLPEPATDRSREAAEIPSFSDRFRAVVFVGLTGLMVGLCVYLAVPFVPAITWGIALAVVAWPVHTWMRQRIPYPSVAATISTSVVVVTVLVPALFVSYQLATEASAAAEHAKKEPAEDVVRGMMVRTPVLNQVVDWMDRVGVDLNREIRKLIESRTRDTMSLIQGSLTTAIQFLVMLFVMYYLFRDRDYLLSRVRALLPLNRSESDRVFGGIVTSVHSGLYATVVCASINGLTSGLMFWAVGLPSPVLWGTVIFVLSVVPILGNILVWIPAVFYLALLGRWWGALGILTWGIGSAILVDTILFVRLAGNGMRMHKLPTMLAYMGGLAVFGMSGLVLGPAILGVAAALLSVWHERSAANGTPVEVPADRETPSLIG